MPATPTSKKRSSKRTKTPNTREKSTSKTPPPATDCALSLKTPAGATLDVSYWDLYFCILAGRDFGGSLDALRQELRRLRDGGMLYRESYVAKLSHLNELRRRLAVEGVGPADVVEQAGSIPAGQVRRANNCVLLHKERQSERSEAMLHTPKQRGLARALRGGSDRFPVAAEPFRAEIIAKFDRRRFYTESQSFAIARKLNRYAAKAQKQASQGKHAEALAVVRGELGATIELMECADDSYGVIGDSFRQASRPSA